MDDIESIAANSYRNFRAGDGHETPSMDGLYDKMTYDHIISRLKILLQFGFQI